MKLIKSVSIYTISGILLGGINFFLMPAFTHFLSKEDFGHLSLITSYISFLTPVLVLGSIGVITIEYFKMELEDFKNFLSASIVAPFILFGFISLLTLFFATQISAITHIPVLWVKLLPLLSISGFLMQMHLNILQIREQPNLYSIINISFTLTSIVVSLLLIVQTNMGFEGRLIGLFIANFLFSILGVISLYKWKYWGSNISKQHITNSLQLGIPLIPHSISFLVIDLSDRIFIASFLDLGTLGEYNIGYQMGVILFVIVNAFVQGYSPFLFNSLKEGSEQAKIKIVQVSYAFILALVALLGLLVLATPYIFQYIIDEKFAQGAQYVFWVGLGYVFLGMYKMVIGILFFEKKTRLLGWLALVNVLINLILNYFLIQHFGAMGAAYATTLSFLIIFIITFVLAQNLYKLPWFDVRVFKL